MIVKLLKTTRVDHRHLFLAQKCELGKNLLPIYEDRAEERQEATLPQLGEKGFQSNVTTLKVGTLEIGEAVKLVAERTGFSHNTNKTADGLISNYHQIIEKED